MHGDFTFIANVIKSEPTFSNLKPEQTENLFSNLLLLFLHCLRVVGAKAPLYFFYS